MPSESASDCPSSLGFVKAELIQQDNITAGMRFRFISSESDEIEGYTRAMHESELEKLYLVDFDRNPVAFVTVSEPVTDGVIEFRDFLVENTDSTKSDNFF